MNPLKLSSYCEVERKPCIRWIKDVFQDCLCNINDQISFGFGVASLVCWSVAEIPQIVTNFKNNSASGVSLAFLSTWIIGDVFNLAGCILEPATLPTQFYTALLYTAVTVILALQCIYYNHLRHWWQRSQVATERAEEEKEPLEPKLQDSRKTVTNAPVEVPPRRDFYIMSARSLAGSDTPPSQYYLKARSGPPTLEHHSDSSSDDEEAAAAAAATKSPAFSSQNFTRPASLPRPIPRPVGYATFVAASANLPHLGRALRMAYGAQLSGRRSLQEHELSENAFGQCLGWLMAAIYMGGRIPQIWLNIKRGSVEGLNPWMFVFALIANATYVGSILVRNTEWRMIKANLPWLLDAIVCVLLDVFILMQYIFYKYIKQKKKEHLGEYYGDYYVEAEKPTS